MAPRQIFRLMLRLVGLLIFVQYLPGLINISIMHFQLIRSQSPWSLPVRHLYAFTELAVGLFRVLAALYLITGPRWLVNWLVRERPGQCYECGYTLKGLPPTGRCPECGVPYTHADPTSA